jgi:glycylpeptide N-tetradecanoyltransferase
MAAESKADGKARIQDVVEEIHDDAEEGSSGSEEDAAPEAKASSSTPSAQASTTKKKKKKKKVAKALQSLLKGKDKEVPQALVDEVLHRVQEEQGPNAEGADEQSVRKALEAMKIVDMLQGKSGVGGKNKKDAGDHKVCACGPGSVIDLLTQPVPQIGTLELHMVKPPSSRFSLGEGPPEADGPIEPSKPREEVRQEPYPLPKDFQWSQIDMTDDAQAC